MSTATIVVEAERAPTRPSTCRPRPLASPTARARARAAGRSRRLTSTLGLTGCRTHELLRRRAFHAGSRATRRSVSPHDHHGRERSRGPDDAGAAHRKPARGVHLHKFSPPGRGAGRETAAGSGGIWRHLARRAGRPDATRLPSSANREHPARRAPSPTSPSRQPDRRPAMGLFKRALGRLSHKPMPDSTYGAPPAPLSEERKGHWWITPADKAKVSSASTQMAVALAATGKPFYEGTADPAVVRRRRATNKRARAARRVQRARS